ncbi:hypothetical protein SAMN05421753_12037 [Planctomicrobium piriforme]|uniref:Lipocalin-like domain-containing protein n=1 Tax=Planctomicrobium piriforme TaxID=1576369 RepID=A0A1I3R746_9PLAN|nr:hypothetical protein SAMN05421753_12037 [Planctomicrobium piriforme]
MRSRRRLKLAVVLLMAAGLMGGVAFRHLSEQSLNAEERRLVGGWFFSSYGFALVEYRSDRCLTLATHDSLNANVRWRLKDNQLTFSVVNKSRLVPLPESLFEVADYIPGASRFVYPRETISSRFQVRWNGDDEIVLISLPDKLDNCGAGCTERIMSRVPAVK